MQPHSIPRRSFAPIPQASEPIPINWRRGLFRIWLLISAAWMMSWIIYLIMFGLQGGFKTIGDYLVVPVLLCGPPVALLIFGLAARWAFRGFQSEPVKEAEDE
jgi:hypothetical protein